MSPEEKLSAYEALQSEIQTSYAQTLADLDQLRKQGRTKSVSYREALGRKFLYQSLLDLFQSHGL